jgi:hypothetical protein
MASPLINLAHPWNAGPPTDVVVYLRTGKLSQPEQLRPKETKETCTSAVFMLAIPFRTRL